ncbi:MBL fold metallo-hydrolase [Marinigracilibium pacificum]|uniref:MBL fold metallo-hydrolase n=1 Tax=Marinigracilibium pacificum TaxID=2729599 RepID=A0A848IZV8_9BACT|nr:MBL fold metallo-hydrolase [Marinigracilibium pacificum]NMM47529.1 MBL fold metallo-hydrolase [Marinigracilibium pacificum]
MVKSPQFGKSVRKKDLIKFKNSPNWDGEKFVNLSETTMNINLQKLPGLLKQNFTNKKIRTPAMPLEVIPFDKNHFLNIQNSPGFAWYGHSVLLMRLNDQNILIDPMFGEDASPIAPFKTKRFSENTLNIIDQLPNLDAVFITHDHYDHLDLRSIKKLTAKVSKWFVALGVSRHLEKWGVDKDKIKEFDWWDSTNFKDIKITFTPSRHFSGRGLLDRAKSLWGGWVFQTDNHSVYWSGDGGYDTHFKEVRKKFGSFDVGFMECGQYNEHWHQIHMYPEEAIQAAIDSNVKTAIPVHWGGFALALHSWKDPIERFVSQAKQDGVNIYTPSLGEIFSFNEFDNHNLWWETIS